MLWKHAEVHGVNHALLILLFVIGWKLFWRYFYKAYVCELHSLCMKISKLYITVCKFRAWKYVWAVKATELEIIIILLNVT